MRKFHCLKFRVSLCIELRLIFEMLQFSERYDLLKIQEIHNLSITFHTIFSHFLTLSQVTFSLPSIQLSQYFYFMSFQLSVHFYLIEFMLNFDLKVH